VGKYSNLVQAITGRTGWVKSQFLAYRDRFGWQSLYFPREELLSFLHTFDDGYPWSSWEGTSFTVLILGVKLKLCHFLIMHYICPYSLAGMLLS
jgi:hypothetical protein